MKNRFIITATVAMVGVVPVAASVLTASVASATPTPIYSPVPFDLANLIANPNTGITAATHFEQTLTDASGNYWVDTVDGKLIEISKSLPHLAVGYLNLGGGVSLFDAVAIGNTFYLINQGSATCPVEVVNVAPANLTLNTSTLEYTLVKGGVFKRRSINEDPLHWRLKRKIAIDNAICVLLVCDGFSRLTSCSFKSNCRH